MEATARVAVAPGVTGRMFRVKTAAVDQVQRPHFLHFSAILMRLRLAQEVQPAHRETGAQAAQTPCFPKSCLLAAAVEQEMVRGNKPELRAVAVVEQLPMTWVPQVQPIRATRAATETTKQITTARAAVVGQVAQALVARHRQVATEALA